MEESDSNLAMTNNDFLKSMDTMDVCYPIAMQDDLESIHSLLCWVVDSFCCGSVEDIPKGITRTSGEITLSGGYNLDYDIGEKVFGVSKDGNLVKILVFTTYEKDVRMDKYHLLTA